MDKDRSALACGEGWVCLEWAGLGGADGGPQPRGRCRQEGRGWGASFPRGAALGQLYETPRPWGPKVAQVGWGASQPLGSGEAVFQKVSMSAAVDVQ